MKPPPWSYAQDAHHAAQKKKVSRVPHLHYECKLCEADAVEPLELLAAFVHFRLDLGYFLTVALFVSLCVVHTPKPKKP